MNKILRIFAIKLSLFMTKVDFLFRWVFRRTCTSAQIDEFISQNNLSAKSPPEEVSRLLRSKFVWRADKTFRDYAKDPRVFLHDATDDCDGFAMFTEEIMLKLGFSEVFRVYVKASSDRGHVVCVVKYPNGTYHQLGNWQTFQFSDGTLFTIAKAVAAGMAGNPSYAMKFERGSLIEYYAE